jgi:iron complex transport system permease protein
MKPLKFIIFALIFLGVALVSLALGKYPLPMAEIVSFFIYKISGRGAFDAERLKLLDNLIFEIRFPRLISVSLIGAALSVSGALYQAIFINPLVSPGILGVLAGASFGAALGMVFLKTWYAVQISTVIGGFAAVGVALGVARIYKVNSTIMLVLGGIISGTLFSSLLSIVKYLSDPYNQLAAITYWLMGNTSMADRTLAFNFEIPIGIVTALIGIPFFMLVLKNARKGWQ